MIAQAGQINTGAFDPFDRIARLCRARGAWLQVPYDTGFAALSIPYRSIDLDSGASQRTDLGGRIRSALRARTGEATIPQIFVGGVSIGGCTNVFEAARSGSLRERLRAAGVAFDGHTDVELSTLLPKWLKT